MCGKPFPLKKNFEYHINHFNLTNKDFVKSIFVNGLSDNLLEICISGSNIYDYFETDIFFGCNVNYTKEFEIILSLEDINIDYFKFQPYSSNSVITCRYLDTIEFSTYLSEQELTSLKSTMSSFISRYTNDKRW